MIEEREKKRREELEKLKQFSGPAFMGNLMATFSRGKTHAPRFIRRGYEANIVDELRDFYAGRPWRMRTRRSGRTWKEQQQMLRRLESIGQIKRVGGGRFERAKRVAA